MPKTISQIHADWKAAKATYANFIKFNEIKFDKGLGAALDKAVEARKGTDWKKTVDAQQKAQKIANGYYNQLKSFKIGGSKKTIKGGMPQGIGHDEQKALLKVLYDVQNGIGLDMQYVKQLYGK